MNSVDHIWILERIAGRCPGARVVIEDLTAAHIHHPQRGGGGHLRLTVVWPGFTGMPRRERHRLIYDLFADAMPHRIHALSLRLMEHPPPEPNGSCP